MNQSNRLSIETTLQKAARLQREIREYRVETLQAAARILEQLDCRTMVPEALEKRDKIVAFLNHVAELIRKVL